MDGVVLVSGADSDLAAALRERGHEVRPDCDPAEAAALVTVAPRPELRPLAETGPEAWLDTFRSWTEEPFFVAQRYLRGAYERAAGGCWVAVGSVLGLQPFPGSGAAGAAARALQTLVRVAAIEGGHYGVRANVVALGWCEGALPPELDTEQAIDETPLRRFASSADVAGAVSWLLSDAAAHVSGTVLRVDGGYSIVGRSRRG